MLAHNIDKGFRTQDVKISQDVTFDTMLLASDTLQGLKNAGFYKPSPVQLHGIPLGKCGFDLLLEAKSGTGKTAVFSVIALEKLELDKGLQAVILAPTREIAAQICDVINQIGINYKDLDVEVVIGGLPFADDVAKFKKNVHIVVGSPGRLRHLIQRNCIDVSSVRLLVLDEADKLMDKSFLADINYIFSVLPNQKQVIMSSATYPETTKTFISKYVKCAQHVCPDSNCVLLGVEQRLTVVRSNTNIVRQTQYRFKELLKILTKKQFKQCLIFCNYQARVYELYKLLIRENWPVEQLCGKQEQLHRLDALKTLQEYKCRILASSDLAARGIDASNVDLVINFEPPFDWQTYLHRIGRAGRYGSYGMSVTILSEGKEEARFKELLESINLDAAKVTHFWTNDKTDVNDGTQDIFQPCVLPSNNLESDFEIDYNELWEELSSDTKTDNKMDDFEVLCNSFESSKHSSFESFTDLINSYKTILDKDIGEDNTTYKCINIKPKVIKQNKCLVTVKSLNNYNDSNMNPAKSPIKNSITKDNNDNDVCTAFLCNNKNFVDIPNNKKYNSNLKIEELSKDDNNSYDQCFDKCDNTEVETLKKTLLDSGISSSFGSSENNIQKKKNSIPKNNKSKHFEKMSYKQNYNSYMKVINYKDSYQHRIQETFNKSIQKVQNKNKHSHKSDDFDIKNGPKVSQSRLVSSDDNSSQDYINWYNQLKARVKYIELSFYIDEITKNYNYV